MFNGCYWYVINKSQSSKNKFDDNQLNKLYLLLDSFKPPERAISKPLRLCVSDVYKSAGSGFSIVGRVETGQLRVGDKVLIEPQGEIAQIKSDLNLYTIFTYTFFETNHYNYLILYY